MKRRVLVLPLLLFLLAGTFLPASQVALAHSVIVDGSATDWTMAQPAQVNLGVIGRNAAQQGEYVWRDMGADERTEFASPDTRVDLVQFRVTADTAYLYFMATVSQTDIVSGDGAPMLQVAIDRDRVPGSGQTWLGGSADTQVSPSAAWERLVVTRFGSGTPAPKVFDTSWNDLVNGDTLSATNVLSSTTDLMEIRVLWSVLGFTEPPTLPLRFTVATFRATPTDDTWDIPGASNALDCVTNYGDPGALLNTLSEVSDGVVDYYFDLWFESDGDPYPPLLSSEFQPNPPVLDINREWIEIYNNTSVPLSLNSFRVGDEETIGYGEGMFQFPDGYTIAPDSVIIVAQRAYSGTDGFYSLYGFCPDFEIRDTTAPPCSTPNMSRYATWASSYDLQMNNNDDEVLILDPADTIIDLAGWTDGGYTPYPGVTYLAWNSSWTESIERRPVYQDTNDCTVDFRRQFAPTPGRVWPDLLISKAGAALALPGSSITYTISYSNTGVNDAHSVVIADLLPSGVSYVADSSGFACPACSPGATGTLTWSVGVATVPEVISFDLVGWVPGDTPFGSVLTNTATITTPDNEISRDNNSDFWVSTVSPLDLVVQKTGPQYAMGGRSLVYDVTLQNAGVITAANVVLTDILPISTTYLADNSAWACPACVPGAGGPLVWNVGDVPSDTIYTFQLTVTVDAGVAGGTILTNTLQVRTTTPGDNPANNTAQWGTTVYPPVSIHDIQWVPDPANDDTSPYNNQIVWVEGGVVAVYRGAVPGYTLADPYTYGPWEGLFVFDASHTVTEGQVLLLLGQVYEYYQLTELRAVAQVEVISDTWPVPSPVLTTTAAISTVNPQTAEPLESVLVEVRCAEATNPDLGYGEWGITDQSGVMARVDDLGYAYTPTPGEQLAAVRGMLFYSYADYKIEPRGPADVLGGVPGVVSTVPADEATDVSIVTNIQATFNMSLTASTVNTATFYLEEGPGGILVPGTVSYVAGSTTATFDPAAGLTYTTAYVAHLTTGIQSFQGSPLCEEYTWSFTTAAQPVPDLTPSIKIANPAGVQPGALLTYTIFLYNAGDANADATITDVVPLEVSVITPTLPPGLVYSDGLLLWSGVVATSTQVPLVLQTRAHADLVTGQVITNVVWIDDGVHGAFTRTAVAVVLPEPNIAVDPTVLDVILNPGGTVDHFVTVSNLGDADLVWSLVENPAEDWLSESPTMGTVLPAEIATITVSFDATGLSADTYTTTLEISSNDPDEPLVAVEVTLVVTTGCIPVTNANFTWMPVTPTVGQPVTFRGTAEGLEPISFTWNFGDSGTGSGAIVNHTYTVSDTYTVLMTATNACNYDVATQLVPVVTPPQPRWTIYLPVIFKGYNTSP